MEPARGRLLQAGIDLENRTQILTSFTEDMGEAVTAFLEKRPARFGSHVRLVPAHPARRATDERVTGFPTSSNRASSLHLHWDWGPSAPALVAVSAVLTVVDPPRVGV